ncbi:uncharacterized protein H6S33_009485 [Morchella sextelata]|uniref:uncharacterized protein n=1 Tax=Morchella sextelata TaxID=1174677 RepID=UPI001D03DB71|nr:uncharacterized protein H6S33_009485 [Morchella sextelata]KAH0613105.1 hypothetical protein H6S33_009485 [Morchella sextelata]
MSQPPTPSTTSPDKPPHPVHHIYPIFVPADLSDNFIHAFAGATAGFASGIATCPLDVIKTKLQAQGGWSRMGPGPGEVVYRGLFGTASTIWKDEGFRGMYRGLGPLILGYLPTWMVYFTVYEKAKKFLEPQIERTWVTHILSAMTAGASSTICTNPIWVIKTRLMSQPPVTANSPASQHYTSTLDAMRKMYMHEGVRAFYSGLAPALLGLTHVAVQFPLYEQFKKMFTTGAGQGQSGRGKTSDFWGILAASCLSKICASSATYPHEVVRTRLQTQRVLGEAGGGGRGRVRYRGVIQSFATVFREEGLGGFYAGMGTNMIRAVPASAMTLLTYEFMVGRLTRYKEQGILERDRLLGEQSQSSR